MHKTCVLFLQKGKIVCHAKTYLLLNECAELQLIILLDKVDEKEINISVTSNQWVIANAHIYF